MSYPSLNNRVICLTVVSFCNPLSVATHLTNFFKNKMINNTKHIMSGREIVSVSIFSSCDPVARLLRGITPSLLGENVSVQHIHSVKWLRWLGSHPGSLLAVTAELLYVTGIDGYLQT